MKLCRFMLADGIARTGEVVGEHAGAPSIVELERAIDGVSSELAAWQAGAHHPLSAVTFLPPSLPTKIVAVGVNYRAHAAEFGKAVPEEPLLFLKPTSALCAHGQPIVLPAMSALVHHEAELALVIGRRLHRVSAEEARHGILGFTCLNDVTARDLQRKDGQFTRGKGFDTFAPVGPFLVTDLDPSDLGLRCRVNGELRQDGRTSDMVWDVYALVSFISRVMTLFPGDIVTTGTPPGVGPLIAGDVVEVELEGVGVLQNLCIAEAPGA